MVSKSLLCWSSLPLIPAPCRLRILFLRCFLHEFLILRHPFAVSSIPFFFSPFFFPLFRILSVYLSITVVLASISIFHEHLIQSSAFTRGSVSLPEVLHPLPSQSLSLSAHALFLMLIKRTEESWYQIVKVYDKKLQHASMLGKLETKQFSRIK